MSPYPHIHIYYALLAVIFVAIVSYMIFYNRRSKDHQKSVENHGVRVASKEAGIMEAQESMKQERRHNER